MIIYIHFIFFKLPYLLLISYFYSCNLTILIIPEYYVPLYSAFEQVLLPGDTALYKCFLLLLLLLLFEMSCHFLLDDSDLLYIILQYRSRCLYF